MYRAGALDTHAWCLRTLELGHASRQPVVSRLGIVASRYRAPLPGWQTYLLYQVVYPNLQTPLSAPPPARE
jgi:hypothetical protein